MIDIPDLIIFLFTISHLNLLTKITSPNYKPSDLLKPQLPDSRTDPSHLSA